jgi:heme o synthase
MFAWTLLLAPVTSWIYVGFALVGGLYFVVMAHKLHAGVKAGRDVSPMKLFHLSNIYLCGLFLAIAIDAAIALPTVL